MKVKESLFQDSVTFLIHQEHLQKWIRQQLVD